MKDFVFHSPTKVVFGRDAENQTGKLVHELGAERVLIVYGGGSVVRSGLLARVEAALQAEGIAFERCGGVQPNPRLAFAEAAVRQALSMKADCILAVGGGSAIDTAKAVAHGAANPDIPIWDFWSGAAEVTKSLPIGSVLTIPAAGSETSDSAVLTNEAIGIKRGLPTPWNRPKFAVMNPALAMTLPAYQISCGIADILMHTLDRYFTHTKDNALTDAFAEALLRTTMHYGVIALENPQDYNAMSELMWCGSLSHNGLTGLGAETDFGPHKLGHELSALFDVAHGASLTAVWGSWARHVYREEPERFALFAKKVFDIEAEDADAAALAGIAAMEAYFNGIHMPISIPELNVGVVPLSALEKMADQCTDFDRRPVAKFKVLHRADALAIYTAANRPEAGA